MWGSRGTTSHCPLCGAHGAACGPGTDVAPLDLPPSIGRGSVVTELREYHVILNGHPTTMQLTAERAKLLGGTPVVATPPTDPPSALAVEPAPVAAGKARATENKARTPVRRVAGGR